MGELVHCWSQILRKQMGVGPLGDLRVGVRAADAAKTVILATTTSTQDSGLLEVLVPIFEKDSGYVVKTISVGSGQAM